MQMGEHQVSPAWLECHIAFMSPLLLTLLIVSGSRTCHSSPLLLTPGKARHDPQKGPCCGGRSDVMPFTSHPSGISGASNSLEGSLNADTELYASHSYNASSLVEDVRTMAAFRDDGDPQQRRRPPDEQIVAVTRLVERLMPGHSKFFEFSLELSCMANDTACFQVTFAHRRVLISGTTGETVCRLSILCFQSLFRHGRTQTDIERERERGGGK